MPSIWVSTFRRCRTGLAWTGKDYGYLFFGVEAEGEEAVHDAGGDEAVPGVFPEHSVGALLAWRFDTVAVIDKDYHSWFFV